MGNPLIEKYGKPSSNPLIAKYGSGSPATPAPQEEISKIESGLRGIGQGATFGFSDEAIAAIRRMAGGDYDELLKEERLKNELAKKANPLTYGGSELGTNIAMSFIPGVGLAKGAGVLKNVASAAGMGALSGAGYAEEDKLKGAGMGAAISGALGAGGALITKGMQKLAPRLAEKATGATGRDLQYKFKPGSGQELLDRKTIGWVSSPADIARKAQKELTEASTGIGESLKNIPGPSKTRVIENLNAEKLLLDPLEDAGTIAKIDKFTKSVSKMDDNQSAQTWWNRKIKADKKVNWQTMQTKPQTAQFNAIKSRAYRNAVEEAADTTTQFRNIMGQGGDDVAKNFADDRKLFSLYAPIKEAAEKKAATINQRDIMGLIDSIALTGGVTSDLMGGGGKGTAAGLGWAGLRRGIVPRIPSTLARTLNSSALQNATLRLPVSSYRGLLQGDE